MTVCGDESVALLLAIVTVGYDLFYMSLLATVPHIIASKQLHADDCEEVVHHYHDDKR